MSCMACKLKGKASNICRFRDALSPLLDEIAEADGLVLGSPIYFSEVTGKMRAFLERLTFPWLSYNDYSLTAPKRMPVVLVETMNGTPERNNSNHFGTMEWCLTTALGDIERIIGYNTCRWRNTIITNSVASQRRQSTLGVMLIGRRICSEPTMPAARWRSNKRL